jgi:hypothetical protein
MPAKVALSQRSFVVAMLRLRGRFLLLGLMALSVRAQQVSIYDDPSRTLYQSEAYGGFTAHGDGWGLCFYSAKYTTAKQRRLLGVEVVGMKHPKEVKSFNPYYEDSRGYFYGKSNSMLIIRPMFGRKTRLTEKVRNGGVEVSLVWGLGPSLGLLKPVYLQIGKPGIPYEVIVVERYDPAIHSVNNIFGRASWFTGVGEMQLYPGAFGRFAFNFEHATTGTGIKSIEVGATIDAFLDQVPIMAEVDGVENKQFFLEFYLSLQFGKKTIR